MTQAERGGIKLPDEERPGPVATTRNQEEAHTESTQDSDICSPELSEDKLGRVTPSGLWYFVTAALRDRHRGHETINPKFTSFT